MVFYYSYSLTSQKLIDNFNLSAAPFLRFLGFELLESAGSSQTFVDHVLNVLNSGLK